MKKLMILIILMLAMVGAANAAMDFDALSVGLEWAWNMSTNLIDMDNESLWNGSASAAAIPKTGCLVGDCYNFTDNLANNINVTYVGNTSFWNFNNAQPWTICALFRSLDATQGMITGEGTGSNDWAFLVDSNKLRLFVRDAGGTADTSSNTNVNDGDWVAGCVRRDPSNSSGEHKIFINGSLDKTGDVTPRAAINNREMFVGRGWDDKPFKGEIDELYMWRRALTNTEIKNISDEWFLGNGLVPGAVGPSIPNITLNVINLVNNSYLAFNATIGNSSDHINVTSGSDFNASFNFSTGNYTINISVADHIDTHFVNLNLEDSKFHTFNTTQAFINVTLVTPMTRTIVGNFTATNNKAVNNSNSSLPDNTTLLPANVGLNNVQLQRTGYFTINQSINVSVPRGNISRYINISDQLLNINVTYFNNGTIINNFTLHLNTSINYSNISNNYFSQVITTYNTSYLFYIESGFNWTVIANNTDLFVENNYSIAITSNWHNRTLKVTPYNSLNVTIYNELDRSILQNDSIELQLISQDYSTNYTIPNSSTNGTVFFGSLPAASYTILTNIDGFVQRIRYIDTSITGGGNINLYMLDDENSTTTTFTITDQFGDDLENATVKALRYYLIPNGYIEVADCRTNFVGKCNLNLRRFNTFYRFLIEYNGESVFTSGETEVENSPESFTFQVNTGGPTLDSMKIIEDVTYTLEYDNTTTPDQFQLTFSGVGTITQGCLAVEKISLQGTQEVGNTCLEASAGIITIPINDSDRSSYRAIASASNGDGELFTVDTLSINLIQDYQTFGNLGIFISIIITIFLAGIGAFIPSLSIILAILGLLSTFLMGFTYITITSAMLLLAMGAIIIFKMRR